MSFRVKVIIVSIIALALLFIFIRPDFSFLRLDRKVETFHPTPKATAALEQSMKKGRPVFLKFYAKW